MNVWKADKMTVNGRPAYTESVKLHNGWQETNIIKLNQRHSEVERKILFNATDAFRISVDSWDLDDKAKYNVKMNFKARFKATIEALDLDGLLNLLENFNAYFVSIAKESCDDCKITLENSK